MRPRPEKIGCGTAGVLVGSTGLVYIAGQLAPDMSALAMALLLGCNLLLWIGLLAVIEGQKEDIIARQQPSPLDRPHGADPVTPADQTRD